MSNRHRHPEAHQYLKLVRWSEEDQAFIGSCPPIIGDACHGDTEAEVINQLVVIVDEWIDIFAEDGRPLPAATNKTYSGKLPLRIDPDLHRAVAAHALVAGQSINRFVESALKSAVSHPASARRTPAPTKA